MSDIFKGMVRIITYTVLLVKRTVFTIPFRILKKIAGNNIKVSNEQYGKEALCLWLLAGVSSFIGLPAVIPNVFVYVLLLLIGEYLFDLIKETGLLVDEVKASV